jgi:Subtilase family
VGSISSMSQLRRPVSAILLIIFASKVSAAQTLDSPSRMTPRVQNLVNAKVSQSVDSIAAARQAGASARYDSNGRLQIDVDFDCTESAPNAALMSAGMVIGTTVKVSPMCVVEGWAPMSSILTLASLPAVKKIDLPKYSKHHPPISPHSERAAGGRPAALTANGTPAIDGNGITIMNADKFIQQTSVNGAGITIGVMSTDVTSLATIQGRGELPASVNVVQPSANPMIHSTLTDEGTMMLEEVYAVAPGANLAFCGPETGVEYLGCMQNLIAAGVTVISDDLTLPGVDVMSAPAENNDALAIENLLTANPNVMLYHSAGNDAQDYWQGAFNPLQLGGTCYPSGTQTPQNDRYFQRLGTYDGLAWQTNGGKSLFLASVLPVAQTTPNNFDLYVYDGLTSQWICSTSQSGWTDGSTSYTVIDGSSIPSGNLTILVGAPDNSLSGSLLKIIGTDDGGGTFSTITSGAPSSPQDFATGVTTVGAVYGADGVGNTIEAYSDTGPIQVEVPTASTLQAPILVAPDAVYVDNGGTNFAASGGIFSGTSAASPNAAAVAVLLRSAFPTLTPTQVTTFLETGADPLGGSAPNGTYGNGRVDALGALTAIPAPTISGLQGTIIVGGSSSPALPFTIGGTGVLTVSALPSTNLIPSSSAGILISPSTCGNPTTACALTLTPTLGLSGTTSVQVTVTDGAKRSQSQQIPITVTKPAPPTISLTSVASQSVLERAALPPISFVVAGTGPLSVTATNNGVPGVSLTSGCGTTTMNCAANLGTATNAISTANLLFTVQDSYGQMATTAAAVSITTPPVPTITITSGGNQSVTVNAPISPVMFTVTGTGALTVVPNATNIANVTISAGCGTTTMTCTATLGSAASTAGTAMLMLTVQDTYAQSASTAATVSESLPPGKSGGGALDPWALLGLTGLVLIQLSNSKRKRR